MSNDDVYAAGLLNRALDPATQPPAIQAFLRAEFQVLLETIPGGARVVDFGCGTGRHLLAFASRIGFGIGLDYEQTYLVEASRHRRDQPVHFIACDAAAVPITRTFDFATCLTNTWGTMTNKMGVLSEMRRLAPRQGTRIISLYSRSSVPARREWYRRLGHEVTEESSEFLATAGGFRSEHFSENRLRDLIGECDVHPLAEIGYLVTF